MLGQVCRIITSTTILERTTPSLVACAVTALRAQYSAVKLLSRSASTMVEGLSKNCWSQDQQKVQHPALSQDIQTDVCVVGAGIAGLTTAYRLVLAGMRNVVHASHKALPITGYSCSVL